MKLYELLKKLESDYGWSFHDGDGKLHLEEMQKQLIADVMNATLKFGNIPERKKLAALETKIETLERYMGKKLDQLIQDAY